MKIFMHNENTTKVFARVQMNKQFITGLRDFLHVPEDAPLLLNGVIKVLGSGFGWYTIHPFNTNSKGKDLEFALTQIRLYQKHLQQRQLQELQTMRKYQPELFKRLQAEEIKKAKAVVETHIDELRVRNGTQPRPATSQQLAVLAKVVNRRFSHAER